ncbi:MAG: SurA N-terminal domain-containing protein [Alphaproteobacteria bacterium]|nr:SurA N-terminal domain-containing protein [Alphaproteobacteria bacterium]
MLEYLRNAADKPVAKFLMFVLIFSFVGWGAADWIFGGASRDTTLIKVGDAGISVPQFNNERSRQLSLMTKDEQRAAYTDPVKSAELTKSVMSTLTMNQLALNRAKDLGFVVSDKRIAKEIRAYPQFQVNGEFSSWLFDSVLSNNNLTEQDFASILRTDILRQMAVGATNVPVAVPEFAVDAVYNAKYSKRDVKYTAIKYNDFKVSEPSEEQLKEYYAQHPVIVPEKRAVSYVLITAQMNKPDSYDEGFQKAQKVEDSIISGDSMKVAADKHNVKYVSVPAFARNEKISDKVLSDEVIAKLFSMDSGSESELLELKDGFAIVRVDSINNEHNADFKDVKKSLISDWKKSEQRKQAYLKANESLVALNKGDKIKDMKSATISRTEGAPLVVLTAGFAGKEGTNSITEDKDAFYVVSVGKNVLPKSDANKKAEVRKELQRMTGRFVADDYSQFLKRHYSVKVNEKNYKQFVVK